MEKAIKKTIEQEVAHQASGKEAKSLTIVKPAAAKAAKGKAKKGKGKKKWIDNASIHNTFICLSKIKVYYRCYKVFKNSCVVWRQVCCASFKNSNDEFSWICWFASSKSLSLHSYGILFIKVDSAVSMPVFDSTPYDHFNNEHAYFSSAPYPFRMTIPWSSKWKTEQYYKVIERCI